MAAISNTTTEPQRRRRSPLRVYILSVLLILVSAFGAYSFFAWRHAVTANPTTAQNNLIKTVDDIAVTPSETPQIATVKDAAKLTSTVLASVAHDGDILLIYNKADRIIVYRPTTHKIVDMLSVQSSNSISNGQAHN
jgi:hypothetical protein